MFEGKRKWLRLMVCLCMALCLLGAQGLARAEDAARGTVTVDGGVYEAAASGEGWTLETAENGFALTLADYHGGAVRGGDSLVVTLEGENTIDAGEGIGLSAADTLTIAGEGSLAVTVTSPEADGWLTGLFAGRGIAIGSRVTVEVSGGAYAVGIEIDDGLSHVDTSSSLLLTRGADVSVQARTAGMSVDGTDMATGIALSDSGDHLMTVEKGAKLTLVAEAASGTEESMAVGLDGRNVEMLLAGDVDIRATASNTAYGISAFRGGLMTAAGSAFTVDAQAAHGVGLLVADDIFLYGDAQINGATEAVAPGTRVTYTGGTRTAPATDEEMVGDAPTLVIQGGSGPLSGTGGSLGNLLGGGMSGGTMLFALACLLLAALVALTPARRRARLVSAALAAIMTLGILPAMPARVLAEEAPEMTREYIDGASAAEEGELVYEGGIIDSGIDPDSVYSVMDQSLLDLYASFDTDRSREDRAGAFIIDDILLYMGGKIIDKAADRFIDWAFGDIFDAIFGKDTRHEEIMNKLNDIENRLKDIQKTLEQINAKLDQIIEELRKVHMENEGLKVQKVLTEHRKRMIPLWTAAETTRHNTNAAKGEAARKAVLKDFYIHAPDGNRKTPEYIRNTVLLMQGGAAEMDVFQAYDRFAWLAGGWYAQSEGFREGMRANDMVILYESLSLCSMYQRAQRSAKRPDKDCPITEYDVKMLQDTVKMVQEYYKKRPTEQLTVGHNRFIVPFKLDAIIFTEGLLTPESYIADTETIAQIKPKDPSTYLGIYVSRDRTGRSLTDNEIKAMERQVGVPEKLVGQGRGFLQVLGMGGYTDETMDAMMDEKSWNMLYVPLPENVKITYKPLQNMDEYSCVSKTLSSFKDFSIVNGVINTMTDKGTEKVRQVYMHDPNGMGRTYRMAFFATQPVQFSGITYELPDDMLTARGEITAVTMGGLILRADADGEEMYFMVDAQNTQVEGELKEGAYATVSYRDVTGGETDGPVTHYAYSVVCEAYGPDAFEVSGLVTLVAGNAVTIVDADGEEHGFLLGATEIIGELAEGAHAVATCHRETVEGADTIIVDKLVCSGFVDKPVTVRGTVAAIADGLVTLNAPMDEDIIAMTEESASYALRLVETTKVTGELTPGKAVTATFHTEGEDRIADRIDVVEPPAPAPQTAEGRLSAMEEALPGGSPAITVDIPGGALNFQMPDGLPDGLLVGSTVRVTYHGEDGVNIADGLEVLEAPRPAPAPINGTADGVVTALDTSESILGEWPRMTLSVLGNEVDLRVSDRLPEGLEIGAMAHVHYYEEAGEYIADSVTVLQPPMPGPIDPVPGPDPDDPFNPVPNPNPDDPIDPVPTPEFFWVEGYLTQLTLDDLMPGQLRSMVVSAAGQDFPLTVPAEMDLAADVQEGAFVHADYHVDADGQSLIDTLAVLTPAPMPGPLPQPEDEEPFNPVPNPNADDVFDPVLP